MILVKHTKDPNNLKLVEKVDQRLGTMASVGLVELFIVTPARITGVTLEPDGEPEIPEGIEPVPEPPKKKKKRGRPKTNVGPCNVAGCERPARTRGMCRAHYQKARTP